MYISLNDRNPQVFLNTTIGGIPFLFDGDVYQSVLECFNARKVTPMLWNPETVPEFHRNKLLDSIGFLTNRSTGMCMTFKYNVQSREFNKQCEVFKLLVCAKLFCEYYKSACNIAGTKWIELSVRYNDVYQYCAKLCQNVSIHQEQLLLMDYDLSETKSNWCCIVFEKGRTLPDVINIPKCYEIRMSINTFKALSEKGYSWVNKFPKDTPIKIACEGNDNVESDYYWTLVRAGGYEPNLIKEYVGYEGGFTVFLSSTENAQIIREVNWHRAYVCEVKS